MSKTSRSKGSRGERELINILKVAGVGAKRISMQETGGIDKGDVLVAGIWKGSVKYGNHVPQFLYDARSNNEEMLFARKISTRKRNMKWIICMDLEWFLQHFL